MAHVECGNRFPSSGRFESVLGPFWAGKSVLADKMHGFRRTPPDLVPRPGAQAVTFWLKTWIPQEHHVGYDIAWVEYSPKWWNGVIAKMERRSVACLLACCLLLVVCLLLARFKGRGVQ